MMSLLEVTLCGHIAMITPAAINHGVGITCRPTETQSITVKDPSTAWESSIAAYQLSHWGKIVIQMARKAG